MAIESITYSDGFRIKLLWSAGVRGTIIYSVPTGEARVDQNELMEAVKNGGLQRFNGMSFGNGTLAVSYSPKSAEMQASWIDIYCLDYDSEFNVKTHEFAGKYFNGICKVGVNIKLIPIASNRQAVCLTVQNKSKFAIGEYGIGYMINGRVFGIPHSFDKNQRRVLPQFDIGIDDVVKPCRMDGGYPAEFYNMTDE